MDVTLLQQHLEDILEVFPNLDSQVWAKILYFEGDTLLAKHYLRHKEIVIDNSKQEFNGHVIGLRAIRNPCRNKETKDFLKHTGKILKIQCDTTGNISIRCLGNCEVRAMGYKDPENNCLSDRLVQNSGYVGDRPLTLFSMGEYKSQISLALQEKNMDANKLHKLAMVGFTVTNPNRDYHEDSINKGDAPMCWFCVINLSALDILGNEKVLEEVTKVDHLQLYKSSEIDIHLRRSWAKLKLDKGRESEEKTTARGERISCRKEDQDIGENMGYTWIRSDDEKPVLPTIKKKEGWAKLTCDQI